MKIAFVHEYLNQFGGAERLLQVLSSLFPNAPIYTLFYDENGTGKVFIDKEIRTSFLQKIPLINRRHTVFPLLMPLAIEQFDFSHFDLVISISSSFSKGIITPVNTRHICYCLTPPRFLWDDSQRFLEEFSYPRIVKKILPPFLSYLRIWDWEAAQRVDEFWAISDFVKQRIRKYYKKDSTILYCPVNTEMFYSVKPDQLGNYFFSAGRLVPYKKFDLIIRVFNKLGLPLKIAGAGPEYKKLKKIANSNIEFLGLVSDKKLADLYAHAKAFVFPQEEDFGIAPLESMASGRPVIAYGKGGALETVLSGKTGIFFKEQTEESIIKAIQGFTVDSFSSEDCKNQASKFSINSFKDQIRGYLF